MKRTPHFGQWIDSPGGKRPAVLKRAPQDGQKNRMVSMMTKYRACGLASILFRAVAISSSQDHNTLEGPKGRKGHASFLR